MDKRILGGIGIGIASFLASILFIKLSPDKIVPGTGMEVFRVISEMDGALIGFTAILGVFTLGKISKKERLYTGGTLFLLLLSFVLSALSSLFGLINVGSNNIDPNFFLLPIGFFILGILSLAVFLLAVSNLMSK